MTISDSEGTGCRGYIGNQRHGEQHIWLSKDDVDADNDCYTDGKIAHELMHAYGLYHEHLRPDRSDYIQINYNNIRDYSKNVVKFKKMAHLPTYGVLYDGRSLMHYSSMYLSNGNGPTMISVNFPEMSVVLFGKLVSR